MGGVRCLGLFPKKKRFFLDAFPEVVNVSVSVHVVVESLKMKEV